MSLTCATSVFVYAVRCNFALPEREAAWNDWYSGPKLRQLLEKHPERAIERAVKGMLPRNRLGADILRRLKVYAGPTHPHDAQQPLPWARPTAEQVLAEQAAAASV